jgi:hypothetical protein
MGSIEGRQPLLFLAFLGMRQDCEEEVEKEKLDKTGQNNTKPAK